VDANAYGSTALQLGSSKYMLAPALPASCKTNCTVCFWYKGAVTSGNVVFADATSETCVGFYSNNTVIVAAGTSSSTKFVQKRQH
jgi:hypothetical protein